jgi:hypothetical protein
MEQFAQHAVRSVARGKNPRGMYRRASMACTMVVQNTCTPRPALPPADRIVFTNSGPPIFRRTSDSHWVVGCFVLSHTPHSIACWQRAPGGIMIEPTTIMSKNSRDVNRKPLVIAGCCISEEDKILLAYCVTHPLEEHWTCHAHQEDCIPSLS